jgi:hypothetical protein
MTNRSKGWLWTREVVSLPARSQEASTDLEWQWTLRADGSVWWRLTRVRGKDEHNEWQCAGELDGAAWKALAGGRLTPADYLETYARNHGHRRARRHAAAPPATGPGLAGPVRSLRWPAPEAALSGSPVLEVPGSAWVSCRKLLPWTAPARRAGTTAPPWR